MKQQNLPPKASISNLNDMPDVVLNEARKLGDPMAAEEFIVDYITADCLEYLFPFIDDVVFGSTPAQLWMRGQVIVPDFSLVDQLCSDPATLLKPVDGQFQYRIVPNFEDWEAGISWLGAPARLQPDADYKSVVPDNAVSLAELDTEPVTDIAVAMCRWIACRLACVLQHTSNFQSIDELVLSNAALPPLEQWSDNARRAAQALIHEYIELGPIRNEVPGYRGPDDWFK